jgi:hypothetical protein
MTTEQLIELCAHEDVEVSVTKLARWVREGIIPAHLRKRHGRGRGKGAEWVWARECLPRAIIIAHTLASGDPSLQRAAQMLARAGYAPSAERLRTVLLEGIDAFERLTTHREPYLKQPDMPTSERRRRLRRNLKRKGADLPDPVVDAITTFGQALHGLDDVDGAASPAPTNGSARRGLGDFLSLKALRRSVCEIRESDLLDAYEQAGQGLQEQLLPLITMMNVFMLPFLVDRLKHQRKSVEGVTQSFDIEAILSDLKLENGHVICSPDNPAGLLRLYFTTMLASVRVQGDQMLGEVTAPMLALANSIAAFAKNSGFPGVENPSLVPEGGLDSIESPT